jgi:hypothetical protein
MRRLLVIGSALLLSAFALGSTPAFSCDWGGCDDDAPAFADDAATAYSYYAPSIYSASRPAYYAPPAYGPPVSAYATPPGYPYAPPAHTYGRPAYRHLQIYTGGHYDGMRPDALPYYYGAPRDYVSPGYNGVRRDYVSPGYYGVTRGYGRPANFGGRVGRVGHVGRRR